MAVQSFTSNHNILKKFCRSIRRSSCQRPKTTMFYSKMQFSRVCLTVLLLLVAFVLKASCQLHDIHEETPWKCENITNQFCKRMKYNVTHMPNIMKNQNQAHAYMELVTYLPLVNIQCSPELELFLCSVYVPYCTEKVRQPIMACRTLCERVHRACFPIMNRYGFGWPPNLNCSQFPPRNDHNNMCIDNAEMNDGPTKTEQKQKGSEKPSLRTTPSGGEKAKPNEGEAGLSYKPSVLHGSDKTTLNTSQVTALIPTVNIKSSRKLCRMKFARNGQNYVYIERAKSCALICNEDGLFTRKEKEIVDAWLTGLSYLCASLSLFALIVVLRNMKSVFYPERAIVYITFCYLAYSGAYILRSNVGREKIGCDFSKDSHYTIQDGSGNFGCATTFLMTYLFSMAQSIWWVMMTLTWFLCGGMKWKTEALKSCSVYFHVAAWGVPCGKTVVILMLRKIDVDELTGLCYVGNRFENIPALREFVVGPLFTYLIMGTTFLVAGFVALFKIRPASNSSSSSENSTDSKIEQPLLPIGIFAALHTILSTVILASYFYEYVNRESWFTKVGSPGANFEVFLLRLIMVFAIGLLAAVWVICIHAPRFWKKLLQDFSQNINNTAEESPAQLEPLRGSSETPV